MSVTFKKMIIANRLEGAARKHHSEALNGHFYVPEDMIDLGLEIEVVTITGKKIQLVQGAGKFCLFYIVKKGLFVSFSAEDHYDYLMQHRFKVVVLESTLFEGIWVAVPDVNALADVPCKISDDDELIMKAMDDFFAHDERHY
jgi:hypothetical protein